MVAQQHLDVSRLTKTLFMLFLAMILQSVLGQHVRVFGLIPDVMMTTAILIGLNAGPQSGAWLGLICGLLADAAFRTTPFALSALVFALLGYGAGSLRNSMLHGVPGLNAILVVIYSVIGVVLFAVFGVVFGASGLINSRLIMVAIVTSALDGILAVALSPLARWAWAQPEQANLRVVRA